jgi:hypothetical protein
MVLGFRQHDPDRDGTLEIEEVHPNFVEIYFVPPEHSLRLANLDPKKPNRYLSLSRLGRTYRGAACVA